MVENSFNPFITDFICPCMPPSRSLRVNRDDLLVGNGDGVAGDVGRGEIAAVLGEVNDGGAVAASLDGVAADNSSRAGEGDGAEVSEGHQRRAGLEVLDDPLGVGTAKGAVGLAGEGVGAGLAVGGVLKLGGASVGAVTGNGDGDNVARGDGDIGEGNGCLGDVLVPGLVAVGAILDTPEDTGLDQTGLAGIAINANPGGAAVLGAGGSSRGRAGLGDGESSSDLGDVGVDNDGSSPVGGGGVEGVVAGAGAVVHGGAAGGQAAGSSHGGEGRRSSDIGQDDGGGGGSELHIVCLEVTWNGGGQ